MDLDGVFDDDGDAQGMLKELEGSTVEDITMRTRLLENEIRVLRDESNRLALDLQSDKEKVKENVEKIKMNKQLPYLVGNVVEILDMNPEVGGGGDAARRAIPDPSAPPPPPLGQI
jgi:26S proteasome regulatory subunit T5